MTRSVNKKFKVVIIQNMIVPYEVSLFTALARHPNIDLQVYYCKRTYKERKWDILESKQYKYEVLRGITVEFFSIVTSFNPSIISRLWKGKPDVIVLSGGYVHITMLLAFLFARGSGTHVIYRSDENKDTRAKALMLAKLFRPLERYIIKKSQAVICPGNDSKEYHIENGASQERVFVSPYTTAYDDLYIQKSSEYRTRKDEIKDELGIGEGRVILFAGQLIERKGIMYLLDAFRKLSRELGDTALVLLGEGRLEQQCKKYCYENNLEGVYFAGFVDGEEKIKYFSIADVFVLPTLKDRWGLVINEAMLCNLPVVTTKVAGAARDMIISGENGFIVDESDSRQLYLALDIILRDDVLAAGIAKNAFRTVLKGFNMERRVGGFLSAIKYATGIGISNKQ